MKNELLQLLSVFMYLSEFYPRFHLIFIQLYSSPGPSRLRELIQALTHICTELCTKGNTKRTAEKSELVSVILIHGFYSL